MEGAAVFRGTRVPVQPLLDYPEAGGTVDDLSDDGSAHVAVTFSRCNFVHPALRNCSSCASSVCP
jgi:hypothetical protein